MPKKYKNKSFIDITNKFTLTEKEKTYQVGYRRYVKIKGTIYKVKKGNRYNVFKRKT